MAHAHAAGPGDVEQHSSDVVGTSHPTLLKRFAAFSLRVAFYSLIFGAVMAPNITVPGQEDVKYGSETIGKITGADSALTKFLTWTWKPMAIIGLSKALPNPASAVMPEFDEGHQKLQSAHYPIKRIWNTARNVVVPLALFTAITYLTAGAAAPMFGSWAAFGQTALKYTALTVAADFLADIVFGKGRTAKSQGYSIK